MKNPNLRDSEKYLGLGMQLAGTILAGFLVGFWLDKKWDTRPWCLLGGTALGIVAGFVNFILQLKAFEEQ